MPTTTTVSQHYIPPPVKPYLRRNMARGDLHGKSGICATIQKAYFEADSEDVRFLCRVAMRQAKHLHNELYAYYIKSIQGEETPNDA